jgi:TRAP-type C4-dicarboxylate transport system substrate-binding protein
VRPLHTVADFKGIKIRLPESTVYVETFKSLGANPTTMAFSETFTAVQQKTVDGLEITASAIYTAGYYEVCKYLSLTRHFYSPISINISRSIWDKLSPQEQGYFLEAAAKTKAEQRGKVEAIEQDLFKEMGKTIKINDIGDIKEFQKATLPTYDYARGKIGKEIVDKALAIAAGK